MAADNPKNTKNATPGQELAAIIKHFSIDQLRFIIARQEFPSDREAAESIGITPNTVYKWPGIVKEGARLMALDGVIVAAEIRRRKLAKAMLIKIDGLDCDDEKLKQHIATEIIEWEMGRARQHLEHTGADGGAIEQTVFVIHGADPSKL